jgi:hypothetical protein
MIRQTVYELTRPGISVSNIRITGPFQKATLFLQDDYEIDTIYAGLGQRSFEITDTHCLPNAFFHPLRLRVWSNEGEEAPVVTFQNSPLLLPPDRDVYREFLFLGTRCVSQQFDLLWNDRYVYLRGDGVTSATLVLDKEDSSQSLPLVKNDTGIWVVDVDVRETSARLVIEPQAEVFIAWIGTRNVLRLGSSMYGLAWRC